MTTTSHHPAEPDVYSQMHESPQFADLRRRFRLFVFPMSAAFLLWYLGYVLLADYAHDFMNTKLLGNITVGLVLGLLQFVTTFAIATVYVRYADRNLDPRAARIREWTEGGER